MKTRLELNQELRERILALPGVTEQPKAGFHEDAFFVGRTMFMQDEGISRPRLSKRQQSSGQGRAHGERPAWPMSTTSSLSRPHDAA
jgi:hypothetical protein